MRTNFYELLSKVNFNVFTEYETLWKLFKVECCIPLHRYMNPVSEYIEEIYFRDLSFRGSFTSLEDLMDAIGIRNSVRNIDDLLLFCEFLMAVLPEKEAEKNQSLAKQRKTILGNIDHILERTNHEIRLDSNGNCIIVEKNKAATLAAQLVTDVTVAFELIEYNHFAIKGHLAEKKAILVSVAGYIEPILNSKALSSAGYKQLESDARFVFNNFHIRHNNKEGSKANDYIATISNKDLEEWYDKAYELALSVIIINDYLSIGKEIDDIKPKYAWRT